ncbi:MAG: SIS domain-containing protein [Chlamydiales bacterium]|nr:SIS domain-containing protein [Chlamydiales bacterium]
MKKKILHAIKDGIDAIRQLSTEENVETIEKCAEMLAISFREKKKVLLAGNGGSLCDASHFAEELTGFFRKKRRALPAIALCEPGHLTCVGNDLGFEHIFSRAVEAYGEEGDVFIGLTTSGNSPNLVNAFEQAKELGLKTIAFLGKGGGQLKGVADLELLIDGFPTSDRVQEAHMTAMHIIIEMVEERLFYGAEKEILEEMLTL